jgi:poly-gamma-glutamate capsule biosynthesis protein CapA/YwtB (metallophosphatase superfamily)
MPGRVFRYRPAFFPNRRAVVRGLGLVFAGAFLAACATKPAPAPVAQQSPDVISIVAVGDIMLDGSARPELKKYGYDYPFDRTRKVLEGADIAFANLEGPLTDRGERVEDKKYTFRSPPAEVSGALKRAGFDVVSLANNHTMDYGAEGLSQTIGALQRAGIQHVGAGADLAAARTPAEFTVRGKRIAFLAYSLTFPESYWAGSMRPGTAFGHEQQIVADVRAARAKNDIVAVSFHWGQESSTQLREYQTRLGHAAIDAGASLVIGHHPHVLQAVEHYKGGVILYSLGNFAFGSYSHKARTSVIARVRFHGNRLSAVDLLPIDVYNPDVVFQPTPLEGDDAHAVVAHLREMSAIQQTPVEDRDGLASIPLDATVAGR